MSTPANTPERVVALSMGAFLELEEALQPDERFTPRDVNFSALLLWVPGKRLMVRPKE